MTSPQVWNLYAIKYATMPERTRRDNLMGADPHDDAPMPLDYFVWTAVSPEQTIVIDTGFDGPEATARGRTLQRSVTEGLAMLDIEAASIADVIVTHLHYDHIGGHEEFPAAQFHYRNRRHGSYGIWFYRSRQYGCAHVRSSLRRRSADHLFL